MRFTFSFFTGARFLDMEIKIYLLETRDGVTFG